MHATIRNKLIWGFGGVMLLLALVAALGTYAVFSLRRSAQDAVRIGGRLNATALEIQVHNLEAERRVRSYLLELKSLGAEKAREQYLDEADFEVSAIQSLAAKAVAIAPGDEARDKFQRIVDASVAYQNALAALVQAADRDVDSEATREAREIYQQKAEQLHADAEDGEVAGRDASQTSQETIERVSQRSVLLSLGMSLVGVLLGAGMSYKLSRAILVPVEHLKDVAENVSLGNLDIAVRRYSDDEIGDLADSFSRMVTAVKFFRLEAETVQSESSNPGGV